MFGMKADRFTGRKILVAGALGAVGPALVHGLIRAGAGVLATDRGPLPLAGLADWFEGVSQVCAADPVEVGRWIIADHPDLAGLILADPRDGAGNAALSAHLLPLLARNPDPILAVLRLSGGARSMPVPSGVGLTVGHLAAPPSPADAARLAARLLDAVQARRGAVRLNGPRLPNLSWPGLARSETC
jgi:NAD(P)-dependent dehydrogenase (short-subunit alcohol dehydrogenase family)